MHRSVFVLLAALAALLALGSALQVDAQAPRSPAGPPTGPMTLPHPAGGAPFRFDPPAGQFAPAGAPNHLTRDLPPGACAPPAAAHANLGHFAPLAPGQTPPQLPQRTFALDPTAPGCSHRPAPRGEKAPLDDLAVVLKGASAGPGAQSGGGIYCGSMVQDWKAGASLYGYSGVQCSGLGGTFFPQMYNSVIRYNNGSPMWLGWLSICKPAPIPAYQTYYCPNSMNGQFEFFTPQGADYYAFELMDYAYNQYTATPWVQTYGPWVSFNLAYY